MVLLVECLPDFLGDFIRDVSQASACMNTLPDGARLRPHYMVRNRIKDASKPSRCGLSEFLFYQQTNKEEKAVMKTTLVRS